ncbi:MAG: hypothetical protein JRS35_18865 [Deltaproteobacteria bacterium]|nr:hypothetical protein [Deltaproteobacteria bacterium]
MSFLETIEKARASLERNGRVSLRALQREFNLDDDDAAAHAANVLRTLWSNYHDGSDADGVMLPQIRRALREDVKDERE